MKSHSLGSMYVADNLSWHYNFDKQRFYCVVLEMSYEVRTYLVSDSDFVLLRFLSK